MDNLTHSLTGLMMARVGLGRTTASGGTLMMVLAANAPDIDALFGIPGGLAYIEHHRWYPHSLAMAPVMAVLPLLLAKWIRGASINWLSYGACLLGVLSHLALDFTNVYGIRLFLPFSHAMPHLDMTDIIDPWILLIFFVAIAAPALAGMVGSEIRGRKAPGPKRAWAWVALIALLGYEGFRFAAHQRAVAMVSAYSYGGESPHIWAFPGSDPLRWKGVVETANSVLIAPVVLTQDFDPNSGEVDYQSPDSPAATAARATHTFQAFLGFDQAPFWKVTPEDDDTTRVDLVDLRFGTPRRPGFAAASAIVTMQGMVKDVRFGISLPGRGR